uniref:Uncharacterized protein n=1 Tax=Caenorhabditis japonica TaxID=281687 RepID=A0A8R1EC12_CAEJA
MSRSKWVKTENPSTNNTIHHPPRHRLPANTREIPKCRRHEFACRMEFKVNDDRIYIKFEVDRCETLPVMLQAHNVNDKKTAKDAIQNVPPTEVFLVRPITASFEATL